MEWPRAWHRYKQEASYAILVDGALRSSQDAARGVRFFEAASAVYAHCDRTAETAVNDMRYVPLFDDGVLSGTKWERYVGRSSRIPVSSRYGTDQLDQQPGSVVLAALWVKTCAQATMRTPCEMHDKWYPLLKGNPFCRSGRH